MESWLEKFRGEHVTVFTGSSDERTDMGTLIAIGEGWVQIVKDNGEMLMIPYTAIRMMKLLNLNQTVTATERTYETTAI